MDSELIQDRGRGPELVGTRITIHDLLPYFLDPTATEKYVVRLYNLTEDQVAAARAYILRHPDTILAQHLKIEEQLAVGNPPEVIEKAREVHETFRKFREWRELRDREEAESLAKKTTEGD